MIKRLRNQILYLAIVLPLLVSACAQATRETTSLLPTSSPTAVPEKQVTSPADDNEEEIFQSEPGCSANEPRPTPNATIQAIFPAANLEEDWILGSNDAYITLIEYGDFQ